MRTLLLVRHAKARKADRVRSSALDLARPLSARGRKDARSMGKRLAKLNFQPDLIWASPARRTLETARLLAKKLGYRRKHIKIDPRLYGTTAARLRQLVRELSRKRLRVLLCGHNPELHRLARRLGSNLEELPTCGAVQLSFAVESWSEVAQSTLAQVRVELPRRRRAETEARAGADKAAPAGRAR